MIPLGSRVRDQISGFKGIAVGRTEYLFGCNRISIAPEELHDGSTIGWHTFDEGQLQVLEETTTLTASALAAIQGIGPMPSSPKPGGPRPEPHSHETKG